MQNQFVASIEYELRPFKPSCRLSNLDILHDIDHFRPRQIKRTNRVVTLRKKIMIKFLQEGSPQ